MGHPGISSAGKRKGVNAGNGSGLGDQLASFKMPPHIGIGNIAGGQGDDAQENNGKEYAPGRQPSSRVDFIHAAPS